MKKMAIVEVAAMLVLAGCGGADDGTSDGLPRGVTADSITIGSHTDLSGNLAIWGVPATNGQRMRFDEANAAGGIHGRKIDLILSKTASTRCPMQ
jgi:branched-chain amino acid transport system substrate-binding protein